MKFWIENGIYMTEVPVNDFRITMVDCQKKIIGRKNYCNGGYFTPVKAGGVSYTFPVTHCIADFAGCSTLKAHLQRVGTVADGKARFDTSSQPVDSQFGQKSISTLVVRGGNAYIDEMVSLPPAAAYAISGVPIMRRGADVSFVNFVRPQGWLGSELYATWHVFLALKSESADMIYVAALKTTSGNMVSSAEAYKKFQRLGFRDIIKLDGGGSYYYNADGTTGATSENRRINTIIEFGNAVNETATLSTLTTLKNPYKEPTVAIHKGSAAKEGVMWLQWELNRHGYICTIDGSFGPTTDKLVRKFQKDRGLIVDGSVGPTTRAALRK